jgi:hypothetical protein
MELARNCEAGLGEMKMDYGRVEFEIILKVYACFADDYYDVRDDGAWPVRPWTELKPLRPRPHCDSRWCPGCDLEGDDKSDPFRAPALPFPFSARWLAAWMLDGWGAEIQFMVGEWENGPDQEQLARLPAYARRVKEAFRAAYRAYGEAASLVAPPDASFEANARRASDELNRYVELGEPVPADTRAAYEVASRLAEEARTVWRTRMVVQLLGSASEVDAPAADQQVPLLRVRKSRTDPLTAVVELAIQTAPDPSDPTSAWIQLARMAQVSPEPQVPLIGYVEGEGVKWQVVGGDVEFLDRDAFGARFTRYVKRQRFLEPVGATHQERARASDAKRR